MGGSLHGPRDPAFNEVIKDSAIKLELVDAPEQSIRIWRIATAGDSAKELERIAGWGIRTLEFDYPPNVELGTNDQPL